MSHEDNEIERLEAVVRLVRAALRAERDESTADAATRVMAELRKARAEIERLRAAIGRLHAEANQ